MELYVFEVDKKRRIEKDPERMTSGLFRGKEMIRYVKEYSSYLFDYIISES